MDRRWRSCAGATSPAGLPWACEVGEELPQRLGVRVNGVVAEHGLVLLLGLPQRFPLKPSKPLYGEGFPSPGERLCRYPRVPEGKPGRVIEDLGPQQGCCGRLQQGTCNGFEAQQGGDDHSETSDTDPANTREMLEYLLNQPANKFCADCGTPDPKWMTLPFGAFICIKCSGTHRSLGVHISKVISVNLDEWTDEEVNCLAESGGNSVVNTRYEAFLPENKKPKQDCSTEERNDFIRKKYQFQQFVCDPQFSCPLPLNRKHAPPDKSHQQHNSSKYGFGHTFRNSWRKKDSSDNKGLKKMSDVGMIEFVGLIKVNIVKGTDLAVRDVMSSDPYVMINLGHQSMKTKVIKSTLNPIWNERLMLSIPDPIPPLKLQVFDKDTFSSDDRMGEADVDIRPLIAATKEHENSTITEPTELYRWSASEDSNGVLAKDSVISIANGKVKQEITLKLQNVERGEVEIEIEWMPLSQ